MDCDTEPSKARQKRNEYSQPGSASRTKMAGLFSATRIDRDLF